MHHQINISAGILKPGMNSIGVGEIEVKEGDTLEVSIQPVEQPMEIRALRFTLPAGYRVTGVHIPISHPLPEATESEEVP